MNFYGYVSCIHCLFTFFTFKYKIRCKILHLKGREIVSCVSKSSCNQLYLKCYELAFLCKFWFTLYRRLREFMAFVDEKYLKLIRRGGFQEPSYSQAGMALGLSSCSRSSSHDGVCAFQFSNCATRVMPSPSLRPHLL